MIAVIAECLHEYEGVSRPSLSACSESEITLTLAYVCVYLSAFAVLEPVT